MADTMSDVEAVARRDFDIDEKMWCESNEWKAERARKWEQIDDWERKIYTDAAAADLVFLRSRGWRKIPPQLPSGERGS